jgi:hypothetical protein
MQEGFDICELIYMVPVNMSQLRLAFQVAVSDDDNTAKISNDNIEIDLFECLL